MNRKKMLAILMAAVLVVLTLSGCASKEKIVIDPKTFGKHHPRRELCAAGGSKTDLSVTEAQHGRYFRLL
jgi:hypothetical protein